VLDHPVHLFGWEISKHVLMMWIAAALLIVFFVPACRAAGHVPRGLRNVIEAIVLFLRTQVVEEYLHKEDAKRFLPFFLTLFFFILTCNLLGMIPYGATATGNVSVTAALAICSLLTVIASGMIVQGPIKFWVSLVPSGVPLVLWPLMFVIEVVGLIAKHVALTIRLFANMTAGHIVLGVLVAFIIVSRSYLIAVPSVLGGVAIGLLEIFVAFLQAYIFTFLSAVFVGAALHPDH
jgi:F-type H+-transporting ATPase subunit a